MSEADAQRLLELTQQLLDSIATGDPFEETRVWQRRDNEWRHVHFHRSANP